MVFLFPLIKFGKLVGGRVLFFRRTCSTQNIVRVRFAPSPTGNLHLGGLRTALYNYLFARKNGGKFVLRIEDTDQKRVKPGSEENLNDMLSWAGLIPDESPSVGGPYGPYIQSQRLEKYQQKANELLEAGKAYRCFCSETRLNIVRKEALKNRQNPRYDNKCRHLSELEIEELMAKKQPYTVRFKLHIGPLTFDDVVFGEQTLNISEFEGDFIILKTDGFPTYHFACVVDDHLMDISHVLRGVEWLPSTPKHIMLHSAFSWKSPLFAHLPLLVNRDRTKLSKRQEALGVQHFKDKGCEPLALMNFLAGPGCMLQTSEVFDLDFLCEKFKLSEISRNSCYLDMLRLEEFNRSYLVKQLSTEISSNATIIKFRLLLKETLGQSYEIEAKNLPDEYIRRILNCYKDRISNLSELVVPEMQYLWTLPDINDITANFQKLNINLSHAVEDLEKTIEVLLETPDSEFLRENLMSMLWLYSEKGRLVPNLYLGMLRVVLTGLKDGPGVGEILDMLGKDESLKKLKAALSSLEVMQSSVVKQPSC